MTQAAGDWLAAKHAARRKAEAPFAPHRLVRIQIEGVWCYECRCGMVLFQLQSVILASYRKCPKQMESKDDEATA